MKNISKFLKEIKVYDCNLTKVRIGNESDGGYVALKELCEKTNTVYSFGVENDVGFELDFVNRFPDSHIRLFDPTIDSLPCDHKRFTFFKLGVGQNHERLQNIMLGDIVSSSKLLKMDIEWDEWGAFLEADIETICKFDQLLIEFHIVGIDTVLQTEKPGFVGPHHILTPYFRKFYQSVYDKIRDSVFEAYYQVMKKLNKNFYIFHIHANNSLSEIEIDGYRFPPLIELGFVRKDLVENVCETEESFPVNGLDFPNKTDRPDIDLSYPLNQT
ncbi:hypothetical protein KAR91_75390 [Candidatus Pacearchaeota archaeon]|nr:hypothetical protein [Candidatus Pacearchaeota archaeon]